jgi:hypothetical protein
MATWSARYFGFSLVPIKMSLDVANCCKKDLFCELLSRDTSLDTS